MSNAGHGFATTATAPVSNANATSEREKLLCEREKRHELEMREIKLERLIREAKLETKMTNPEMHHVLCASAMP